MWRASTGLVSLELSPGNTARPGHGVHVDIDQAAAGRVGDLCQRVAARRGGEDDVGVGHRGVGDPLAVDVPAVRLEAGEEDDDRPVHAGGSAVQVSLCDPYALFDDQLVLARAEV